MQEIKKHLDYVAHCCYNYKYAFPIAYPQLAAFQNPGVVETIIG
jgi:hypothetical protein